MAARFLFINDRARVLNNVEHRNYNLYDQTDEDLIKEFRLNKQEILNVCDLVKDDLSPKRCGGRILSLEDKVLLSLKALGSGSFQSSVKDFLNVSQPAVSVILGAFLDSMLKKAGQFIYMPRTLEERRTTKQKLYDVAGFTGVLGLIDGTHIPIIAPHENEYEFVNRKGFHSINCQAICDGDMNFLNVVSRWPGSAHDSFILQNSYVYDHFERGTFGDGHLLGDSGYPLLPWLMTPFDEPQTSSEKKYNKSHKKTRCLVEGSFGRLKMRFRILDHTGGHLCYRPEKVSKMMIVCCMLHNICQRNGIPIPSDGPPIAPLIPSSINNTNGQNRSRASYRRAALAARDLVVATFD